RLRPDVCLGVFCNELKKGVSAGSASQHIDGNLKGREEINPDTYLCYLVIMLMKSSSSSPPLRSYRHFHMPPASQASQPECLITYNSTFPNQRSFTSQLVHPSVENSVNLGNLLVSPASLAKSRGGMITSSRSFSQHTEARTRSCLGLVPTCLAIKPLQLIQNSAVQVMFLLPKHCHVSLLIVSLHWLPIPARIKFNTLVIAH
ncbi:hypothetical protein Z043_113263, partial [Scleropages formosus]